MINTRKGSALTPVIAIITVLVIIVAVVIYNAPSQDEMTEHQEDAMMEESERMDDAMMEEGDKIMEKGEAMMEKGVMMDEGGSMMEDGEAMESGDVSFSGSLIAGASSPLLEFNEVDYQKARASDKLVVLYFYANWCPICKKEFKDTEKSFNELTTDRVVGFRVHYNDNDTTDEQEALAREFGVGYQHTKVFLKDGERILKSPESWSKERYLEEINKNI